MKKSRLFVNLFTGIFDIPTKLNFRRIEYPGKQEGEWGNTERNRRAFSRIPATCFRDDRLHRRKDGLHRSRVPTSSHTKTVVMATKTVFEGKNCAPHGNNLFPTSFYTQKQTSENRLFKLRFCNFSSFLTIRGLTMHTHEPIFKWQNGMSFIDGLFKKRGQIHSVISGFFIHLFKIILDRNIREIE